MNSEAPLDGVTKRPSAGLDRGEEKSKGRLVDLNTGTLRRNHVLIQQTPGVELFIGLGPLAGWALDFAFEKEFAAGSLLAQCKAIDQVLETGDLTKIQSLGVTAELAKIRDPNLRRLALLEAMFEKARVDDPVHPGYPAGDPEGRGGQFRPKDLSAEAREAAKQKLKRLAARTAFKIAASAALQLLVTAALNFVPGEGIVADFSEVIRLAQTAIELGNLASQVNAALDFVKGGPYCLHDLQEQSSETFSSFDAFKKISIALELIKRFGSAGPGKEYHHIVEQGGDNDTNISAEQLHSPGNIVKLPKLLHELISAEYSEISDDDSTKTVREWLQTQSFEEQEKYGIKTLRRLGILRSDC